MRDATSDMLIGRMVDCLFRAAVRDKVAIEDAEAVFRCLCDADFSALAVVAFEQDVLTRTRAKLQRRRNIRGLGRTVGEAVGCAFLIPALVALAALQILAPARAGDAVVTDGTIAGVAPWAPLIIAVLLLLCWLWRERQRTGHDRGDDDPATRGSPAPNLASFDRSTGDADSRL